MDQSRVLIIIESPGLRKSVCQFQSQWEVNVTRTRCWCRRLFWQSPRDVAPGEQLARRSSWGSSRCRTLSSFSWPRLPRCRLVVDVDGVSAFSSVLNASLQNTLWSSTKIMGLDGPGRPLRSLRVSTRSTRTRRTRALAFRLPIQPAPTYNQSLGTGHKQ
jgi:hypothetical protein